MSLHEGKLNAGGMSFALIVGRFNDFVSNRLLEGAMDCLLRHDALESRIDVVRVPGSFEMPLVAKKLAQTKKYNAIVCLGAVIRGATSHYDLVSAEVAKGVARASYETEVPVIFGVLTTDTIEQAVERAGTKSGNKGWEAALSAIEMANVLKHIN